MLDRCADCLKLLAVAGFETKIVAAELVEVTVVVPVEEFVAVVGLQGLFAVASLWVVVYF